jgi:hypothetical protein
VRPLTEQLVAVLLDELQILVAVVDVVVLVSLTV